MGGGGGSDSSHRTPGSKSTTSQQQPINKSPDGAVFASLCQNRTIKHLKPSRIPSALLWNAQASYIAAYLWDAALLS